jgi:hypothetical protein
MNAISILRLATAKRRLKRIIHPYRTFDPDEVHLVRAEVVDVKLHGVEDY